MAPAHTYGDIVAYLPQHKILFAGDIAFFYVAPFARTRTRASGSRSCDRIEKMDVDTIVPGTGRSAAKRELAEMRGYLAL